MGPADLAGVAQNTTSIQARKKAVRKRVSEVTFVPESVFRGRHHETGRDPEKIDSRPSQSVVS